MSGDQYFPAATAAAAAAVIYHATTFSVYVCHTHAIHHIQLPFPKSTFHPNLRRTIIRLKILLLATV